MINIAIDGPSGAGKSYLARQVAQRLNFIYVDTGALYRAIGLHMLDRGISVSDSESVIAELDNFSVSFAHRDGEQRVFIDDIDVSSLIRTPAVSMAASAVSAIPEVRAYLLSLQKDIAEKENIVMDGRDIGTVILPNADVKIFLCASNEARAKRRYLELTEKGIDTTYENVLVEMTTRDSNDTNRAISPTVPAPDAIILDNSELDREETVLAALSIIEEKLK